MTGNNRTTLWCDQCKPQKKSIDHFQWLGTSMRKGAHRMGEIPEHDTRAGSSPLGRSQTAVIRQLVLGRPVGIVPPVRVDSMVVTKSCLLSLLNYRTTKSTIA